MIIIDETDLSINILIKTMNTSTPIFISRFGGSDSNLIIEYFKLKKSKITIDKMLTNTAFINLLNITKKYNGYFDKTDNPLNIIKFCENYIDYYKNSDQICIALSYYLSKYYIKDNSQYYLKYSKEYEDIYNIFEKEIFKTNTVLHNYHNIIESINPFLKAFKIFAEGKKILIISPFDKTIHLQKKNLNNFIKNYQFPNFILLTYNTPITYNYVDNNNNTILLQQLNDNDWFQTVDRMCNDISNLNFDIALLSCGSYSMPLGNFIKKLGKKAIYVGGVLQLFFGILGDRYNHDWLKFIINKEYYIQATELSMEQREILST